MVEPGVVLGCREFMRGEARRECHVKVVGGEYVDEDLGIRESCFGEEVLVSRFVPQWMMSVEVAQEYNRDVSWKCA